MSMNVFRLCGDLIHTFAIWMLLHRLVIFPNAQGVSRRTQELLLLVYGTRCLDVVSNSNFYICFFQVLFTTSTMYTVYLLRKSQSRLRSNNDDNETDNETNGTNFSNNHHHQHRSQQRHGPPHPQLYQDSLEHWKFIVLPVFLLSLFLHWWGHFQFDFMEWLVTFSIILQAFSLLPQIHMYQHYRQVESLTGGAYIFLFGLYRVCDLLNYMYRAHTEGHYSWPVLETLFAVVEVAVCGGGIFVSLVGNVAAAPFLPQLVLFFRELPSREFAAVVAGSVGVAAALTILIVFPDMIAGLLPILLFGFFWKMYQRYNKFLADEAARIDEEEKELFIPEAPMELMLTESEFTTNGRSRSLNVPQQQQSSSSSSSSSPPNHHPRPPIAESSAVMRFLRSDSTAPLAGVMSFLTSGNTAHLIVEHHNDDHDQQEQHANVNANETKASQAKAQVARV